MKDRRYTRIAEKLREVEAMWHGLPWELRNPSFHAGIDIGDLAEQFSKGKFQEQLSEGSK